MSPSVSVSICIFSPTTKWLFSNALEPISYGYFIAIWAQLQLAQRKRNVMSLLGAQAMDINYKNWYSKSFFFSPTSFMKMQIAAVKKCWEILSSFIFLQTKTRRWVAGWASARLWSRLVKWMKFRDRDSSIKCRVQIANRVTFDNLPKNPNLAKYYPKIFGMITNIPRTVLKRSKCIFQTIIPRIFYDLIFISFSLSRS